MARMRRRSYRRRPQKTTWFPQRISGTITVPTTQTNFYLGRQVFTNQVEHEATIERWRGAMFFAGKQAGIWQFSVGAHVVEEAFGDAVAGGKLGAGDLPNLWDAESANDFPIYQSFACVDSNETNMWNGREIDSKSKRRINTGSQVLWFASGIAVVASTNNQVDYGINYRALLKFS